MPAGCEPFRRLVAHVVAALEQRCGAKPKAPQSWQMDASKLHCTCADCKEALVSKHL